MGLSSSRESFNAFPDFSEIPNFPKSEETSNLNAEPTETTNSKFDDSKATTDNIKTTSHFKSYEKEFDKIYERSSQIFKSMTQNPCETLSQRLSQCLLQNQKDISKCYQTMDTYKDCIAALQKIDNAVDETKELPHPVGKTEPSTTEIMQSFTFMETTSAAAPPTVAPPTPTPAAETKSCNCKDLSEKIADIGGVSMRKSSPETVKLENSVQASSGRVCVSGCEDGPACVEIRDIETTTECMEQVKTNKCMEQVKTKKDFSEGLEELKKNNEAQAQSSF